MVAQRYNPSTGAMTKTVVGAEQKVTGPVQILVGPEQKIFGPVQNLIGPLVLATSTMPQPPRDSHHTHTRGKMECQRNEKREDIVATLMDLSETLCEKAMEINESKAAKG